MRDNLDPTQPTSRADENTYREVNYRHSGEFVTLLLQLHCSLLVTTYQAGKLVVLGTTANGLAVSLHNVRQAMGVVHRAGRIAVGTERQIWLLHDGGASWLESFRRPGNMTRVFLRMSFVTGNIHVHELAWAGTELWLVNTLFSCLCTLHEDYSFVPRWQPPFVTQLAAEDRCHLNGLAIADGTLRYVTALGQSNQAAGWRATKATSGCLIDVISGQIVVRCSVHAPFASRSRKSGMAAGLGSRPIGDRGPGQWSCDSGGHDARLRSGPVLIGNYVFVGVSKIRETSVFGGLPIAEQKQPLRCRVGLVGLAAVRRLAF